MTNIPQKISILFMLLATGSCQPRGEEPTPNSSVASVRDFTSCFDEAVRDRKLAGMDNLKTEETDIQTITWSKAEWRDAKGFSNTQSDLPVDNIKVETVSVTQSIPLTRSTIVSQISLPEFSVMQTAEKPDEGLAPNASVTSAIVQHSDYLRIVRHCSLGVR